MIQGVQVILYNRSYFLVCFLKFVDFCGVGSAEWLIDEGELTLREADDLS